MKNKRAFQISLAIEAALTILSAFLIYYWGHSGFTLSLALHLPSSLIGVLVMERIQSFYFSFFIGSLITIIGQIYIFLKLIDLYTAIRNKAKKSRI
ncbi:hypothetical protein ACFL4N_01745 [Thermodesulfobacteriota bacterium]